MTDYQVVRSRRRTVALQVDQTGSVVVRAPMALPAEEIRTFVEKHETCCLLYTSPSPRDA